MRVGCGGRVGRAGHWDNTCVVEENAWSKREERVQGLEEGT